MTEGETKSRVKFFTSPPHECGYLPARDSVTMFADPRTSPDTKMYTSLSAQGFRRSGAHIYRPHCGTCESCVAVRVVVKEFRPNRNHRRTLATNADLTVRRMPARFNAEHFRLYQSYMKARHPDSLINASDPQGYIEFLTCRWCETSFYEFRKQDELLAVAVVDRLSDSISSVYTFYSPHHDDRSLGRFAILKQITWASSENLPWVYLGYWIRNCRKMSYKDEYQPLEYYYAGNWSRNRAER